MPDAFPDRGEIRFRKARDAGGVINATFAFIRRNARELLLGYVALVAPAALAAGVAVALFFAQLGPIFVDPTIIESDPGALVGWGYLGFAAFALLASAVAHAAVGGYVRLYRQGEGGEITAGALWDEGRGFILPLMGMSLLFGLVATLAQLLGVFPWVGGVLYVGLLVWLYPYYMVATVARTIDAPTVLAAWLRARVLVKGSWGFVVGVFILAMLIVGALLLGVLFVSSFVTGLVLANAAVDDPSRIAGMIGLVFAPVVVISVLFYTIPLLAGYFVYGRLTEELEGTALYEDLDALAGSSFDGSPFDQSTPPGPPVPEPLAPPAASDHPPKPDESESDDERAAPPSGFRGGGFGDS